jgi:hypothetical protein
MESETKLAECFCCGVGIRCRPCEAVGMEMPAWFCADCHRLVQSGVLPLGFLRGIDLLRRRSDRILEENRTLRSDVQFLRDEQLELKKALPSS